MMDTRGRKWLEPNKQGFIMEGVKQRRYDPGV